MADVTQGGALFFPGVSWGEVPVIVAAEGEQIAGPFGDFKTVSKGRAVRRGSSIYMVQADYDALRDDARVKTASPTPR